jgi:hypothetical protein
MLAATNANAYLLYFGEDLNNSYSVPLSSIPNASGAESGFLANLSGVGTEDFESQTTGATQPLTLNFPGFGGSTLSATLSGGSGSVRSVSPGTAYAGRYSIPSATSSNFWQVSAGGTGNFNIAFGQDIAALGFYGIDIGDYGGQLQLSLSNGDVLTVNNTVGSNGSTDGTVLFFGLIAENAGELFTSVDFLTTTGQGDVFAFDNFTIGEQRQVVTAPEPATIALMGMGLAGIGFARKKKQS